MHLAKLPDNQLWDVSNTAALQLDIHGQNPYRTSEKVDYGVKRFITESATRIPYFCAHFLNGFCSHHTIVRVVGEYRIPITRSLARENGTMCSTHAHQPKETTRIRE
jgi:hypothetical protein